jgi:hypothetical protein
MATGSSWSALNPKQKIGVVKLSLIDLEAEMPTGRKAKATVRD